MPLEKSADVIVNSTTAAGQTSSAITVLSNGNYVITWTSNDTSGSDTSSTKIRYRLYDSTGTALGTDEVANSTPANAQDHPVVTALADGKFAIAWQSLDGGETSGTGSAIRARFFEATGSATGADFIVNTGVTGEQTNPTITTLSNGNVLVIWESDTSLSNEPLNADILGQIYTSAGTAVGDEFAIASTTNAAQLNAKVTALANGGYAVTWTSFDGLGSDTDRTAIRMRIFDSTGPAGNDVIVNTTTPFDQNSPAISQLTDGKIVVVWNNRESETSGTTNPEDIRMRIYTSAGAAIGNDVVVNSTTIKTQAQPSITSLADGRFAIVYMSEDISGADTSVSCIRIRVFNADGTAAGNDFIVNSTTSQEQSFPTIDQRADGKLVVTWTSFDSGDGNGSAIRTSVIDPNKFNGTAADDSWTGGSSNEIFSGLAGVDTFHGMGGNDKLTGGAGADILDGGIGNDIASYFDETAVTASLTSNASNKGAALGDVLTSIEYLSGSNSGNDRLIGNASANKLYGNGGSDSLYGRSGADYLSGGTGSDTASYVFDRAVIASLTKPSTNKGAAAGDTYSSIENVSGSKYGDTLTGNSKANSIWGNGGADKLNGSSGSDKLYGGASADTLSGGSGTDILEGGSGKDKLSGGTGADKFKYTSKTHGGDTITIFDSTDMFQFEGSAFGFGTYSGKLNADAFIATTNNKALDKEDRFIFDTKTDTLWFDSNGTGTGGLYEIAKLSDNPTLNLGDFQII